MTLTEAQQAALLHARAAYMGPEGGPDEIVVNGRPNLQYTVGMLYPPGSGPPQPEGETSSDDAGEDLTADVSEGDVEEGDATVPLAEEWRPSSVAISFVTDSNSVLCDFAGGTYAPVEADGPPSWQRTPFAFNDLELSGDTPPLSLDVCGVRVQIGSRWRAFGSAWLVTVHARVMTTSAGDAMANPGSILYQVELAVRPAASGRILEYDTSASLDADDESAELRLRYRNRKTYAVGHGMAADWELEAGRCTRAFLDPVPAFVVPAIETVAFDPTSTEARALRLDFLASADSRTDEVTAALAAFVTAYETWVAEQEARVAGFGHDAVVARRIVKRARATVVRMLTTVDILRDPTQGPLRAAFALGMAAMRLQMRQARINEGKEPDHVPEPIWRPFQLGFILVSLASTVDDHHPERDLVDLIWFPTGGGKTEAYLGLAAIEIFRRRLVHGAAGGGTAVITRYTLRLLTAQQFHRTSALICAMELLRRPGRLADARASGMAPFSIGLWVGNEATSGTRREAGKALERLHKAARPEEANGFQVESCPWCGASLVPPKFTDDRGRYGFVTVGRDVIVRCTDAECPFHREIPVAVVDEVLYENPPTVLLATVDKFARLQFRPDAGRLIGVGGPFRQPSLIIQDELHLLSGPLGTTVAVFDAVLQLLLAQGGSTPKIIASTATIRSSQEQVRGLYGRAVALYPPSGLDDDQNFFSRPVASDEGRLYLGLMPQSVSQASAVIAATTPLAELPETLEGGSGFSRDAYWTLVMYHNSLRELGRSGPLVVDDVNARLEARAGRLGITYRRIRPDRVVELTSRRRPEELPNDLRELGRSIEQTDQAVDVVLSSNMLSVGIDVPRLSLMLMVGQPKTTSEYIQATSRVGRGDVRGVVTTLFRSNRARDRSHFETFRSYHESLYRTVEPTSVTPWSLSSRDRSLAGAVVMLLRQSVAQLADNNAAARLDLDDTALESAVGALVGKLVERVRLADKIEADETADQVWALLRNWARRASESRDDDSGLRYERSPGVDSALLKRFGQQGDGLLVGDSMRSVEPNVAVEVREPMDGES
ncbi:helicase-related protein [Pseudonocardia aurantiaca]|uniref:Helicase-related protein n=1 Tax=Pseudonocardia aurantiaca TaxID=75290 RepID=A0ABW4FF76_9PSEU